MYNELIDALRICSNDAEDCEDCSYNQIGVSLLCYDKLMRDAADAIERLTADAVPVVHGEWDKAIQNACFDDRHNLLVRCRCMLCGKDITVLEQNIPNYCPNCGAKMIKEDEQ